MGKYASWGGYRAVYPDRLSKEEFDRAVGQAEAEIDLITAGRAENAPGWAQEKIELAAYALVNEIAGRAAAQAQTGAEEAAAQLVSVSNDGYSEHYEPVQVQAAKWDATDLRSIARRWLSGTGLVSAL